MSAHDKCIAVLLTLTATLVSSAASLAEEYNGPIASPHADTQATDRVIVRWSKHLGSGSSARAQKLSTLSGVTAKREPLDADTDVIQLPQRLQGDDLTATLERLRADADVVYASPDLRRHIHALTNDPLLDTQWYLSNAQPAATRSIAAWDLSTGSPDIVVAVLDTGVRFDHPDLGRVADGGKLLPGYDFVANAAFSNDGDARDADPSDPGDWVDDTDRAQPGFSDCDVSRSSWHGTRVAGLIGALTNNAVGVAGAAFNTRVLPVRVLGKCGGFDSDIIAAMRWAAGLSVSGVPMNPTPASVINLSLGGTGTCTAAYQNAVNEIAARGVLIVASAGNEGGAVSAPANCTGVLGVGGIRHFGTKVGFSNLGTEVGISAPGGNCVNTGAGQPCLFSIVVAVDSGTKGPAAPAYTDEINYNVGTSFSAPQAAAAAALMRSVNDRLDPPEVITLMQRTASAFPVNSNAGMPTCHLPTGTNDLQTAECNCTTQTCGAGMLDAGAAVAAAQRPFSILKTTGNVASGAKIALDASSSFASNGRTLTSYQWNVANVTGATPIIASPSEAMTTVQIPGASQFTLQLTVTDDQGGRDNAQSDLVTPTQAATPPVTTPAAKSGGGGGGGFGVELFLLALFLGSSIAIRPRAVARQSGLR